MAFVEQTLELNRLLSEWRSCDRNNQSPTFVLKCISALLEKELTNYLLLDPDPFDDMRPNVSDNTYTYGHLLKILYDDEEFIMKLLTSYLFNTENDFELNCCAARQVLAMIDVLSGTEIFQDVETHVGRLLTWAEKEKEPLRSYACGLLSVAMQMPECPGMFKERNATLVPLLIRRLSYLSDLNVDCPFVEEIPLDKPCSGKNTSFKLNKRRTTDKKDIEISGMSGTSVHGMPSSSTPLSIKKRKLSTVQKGLEYRKPVRCTCPLTVGGQQQLILKYLHPMGEYQELLPIAFELNVIDLIYHYINPHVQTDPILACYALLFLSSLLCHKKFIVEFIVRGGIQRILEITLPSTVATISSLCLYYVAYSEDALERMCLLPQQTLHCLTEYLLWLLECAHVSGRCHSSLFFSMTFSFRAILNLFDSMDGLRKVINMISTLRILRLAESDLSTDDNVFLDREMAKNACLTLRKYVEAHIGIIADEYKRAAARDKGNPLPTPVPAYKSMHNSATTLQGNIEFVMENHFESLSEKQFCDRVIKLNTPGLLLQLVVFASKWKNYNNRVDVMVSALESLSALSASKKVSLTFCQQIEVSANETHSGMKILLQAVEGNLVQDIYVQKAALMCICNCVSSKTINVSGSIKYEVRKSEIKREYPISDVLKKIWLDIRLNNGIKIILSLLHIKSPITEADSVRALACKTLYGLSNDHLICQILGKLPIFHNEQLNLLMREPVLSDRMDEHEKFTKYASMLIEKVTGKPLRFENYESIPNMSRITKADIIAQTKISYPQKELLAIIHDHFVQQGLLNSANILKEEANLVVDVSRSLKNDITNCTTPSAKEKRVPISRSDSCSSSFSVNITPFKSVKPMEPTFSPMPCDQIINKRFQISRPKGPSLDKIVTEYLREQHAHCSNPVSTCPPFSLLQPHRCPEPRYHDRASPNVTKRVFTRERKPRFGGTLGRKHNLRYLYSRFRSSGCIKESDDETFFTCCAWFSHSDSICLGTQTGDVKIFNSDGQEELIHSCHGAPVSTCYISRDSKLMTTSAPFGNPLGAVWNLNYADDGTASMDLKLELFEDNFVQFSQFEDRIIGTDDITAHVYDLETGQLTRTLFDQRNANHYSKNFACFGPGDDLVLNDGCLWDVRAKKMIHKFDKFNDYVSGIFHPLGLQIIINSEVWDVRTYQLLDTCPALDMCRITFSCDNSVIYGVKHIANDANIPIEHNGMLGPYESSFRTFDSHDYSPIGTVDVKKTIFDLKPNPTDQILAVLENGGTMSSLDLDTTCRYYEIGRMKHAGEEDSDEDQDDGDDHSVSNRDLDDVVTLFSNIFDNDEFEDNDDLESWLDDNDDDNDTEQAVDIDTEEDEDQVEVGDDVDQAGTESEETEAEVENEDVVPEASEDEYTVTEENTEEDTDDIIDDSDDLSDIDIEIFDDFDPNSLE